MSFPSHRALATALLLALLPGFAPYSAAQESALGGEGRIYRVVAGSYGGLVGDGLEPADNAVLALEVLLPDGRERWLVPGTGGPELESSPSLTIEPGSGTVYLIWNSTSNYVHSRIRLVRFSGSGWSEVIEISGNPFSLKLAPRLAVTRDEVKAADGSSAAIPRTLLHTVWWEETGSSWQILYAPIELRNDAYVGSSRLYALSELTPGSQPSKIEPAASLITAPAIQHGTDASSVVAAITDPVTGELLTLRLRLLPPELSELAQDAAAFLADEGARICRNGGLSALATAARDRILAHGGGFRESARLYIAEELREHLLRAGDGHCNADGVVSLAEDARAHIVLIGVEAPTSGNDEELVHKARAHIILIGVEAPQGAQGSVEVVSRRVAPETGAGPTRVYLSLDGRHVLVAWQPSANALLYRESEGDGWGQSHRLVLDDQLSVAEAHRILELRVRSR